MCNKSERPFVVLGLRCNKGTAKSISAALATYNGEAFTQQQFESIARQSHLPAELVVTDDDSTGGTIGYLEQFAKTVPFPAYIHRNPTRLGYRADFMRALSLCRKRCGVAILPR